MFEPPPSTNRGRRSASALRTAAMICSSLCAATNVCTGPPTRSVVKSASAGMLIGVSVQVDDGLGLTEHGAAFDLHGQVHHGGVFVHRAHGGDDLYLDLAGIGHRDGAGEPG